MSAAEDIIATLGLSPLPREGGFFAPTFLSTTCDVTGRPAGSAIYYLLAPGHFSALHRLKTEELWHFYAGGPVEMLQLKAEGRGELIRLGSDLLAGERPQVPVPAGIWQGARLAPAATGPGFALLGCTLTPGWDERDFELGDRQNLTGRYPAWTDMICALTR